jgi:hypothetical protein
VSVTETDRDPRLAAFQLALILLLLNLCAWLFSIAQAPS